MRVVKHILTVTLTLLLGTSLAAAQVCAANCDLLPGAAAAPVKVVTPTPAHAHCHQQQAATLSEHAPTMKPPQPLRVGAPHAPNRSSGCIVHVLTAALETGRTLSTPDDPALGSVVRVSFLTIIPPDAVVSTCAVTHAKPPPGYASYSILRI